MEKLAALFSDDGTGAVERRRPPPDVHELRRHECIIERAILAAACAYRDRMNPRRIDDDDGMRQLRRMVALAATMTKLHYKPESP